MRWRAAAAGALVLVPLDALTIVYDRRSGITHVLAPPAPEILAALAEPMTAAELHVRLAESFDLAAGDDAALAARVAELAAAGLIEAA